MTRLNVGVDLDGVVYPFTEVIRHWIAAETGRSLESLEDAQVWEFYKEQWGYTTLEFLEHYANGVNAGQIFWTGDPYPGAVEGLHAIAEAGHHIHVITNRLVPNASDTAEAATIAWLAEYDVAHHQLTIGADKTVGDCDIWVEDNVENYLELDATGQYPWLMNRPWNQHLAGARRVSSLVEFAAAVNDRASATHISA